MTTLQAVLLGLIQGLTEFLPISSTAHLTLAGKLFGLVDAAHSESWTSFLAVVQLGTLAAVILYFCRDLGSMGRHALQDVKNHGVTVSIGKYSPETRLAVYIVLGTIPILIVGSVLSGILHSVLTKNLIVIAASLVTLAAFLMLAERVAKHARNLPDLNALDAIIIGVAQTLALIPGSSRSGTTMTAGLFLNLTRSAAARFSFLLSIPAVLASGLHEVMSLTSDPFAVGTMNLIVATIVSGISGYAAIAWLLKFLMSRTMMVFVWYRIGLGLLLAVMLYTGIVQP